MRHWSWQGFALAMFGAALWGLAPVATKAALSACNPFLLCFIRLATSACLFHWLAAGDGRWFASDRWVWVAGVALGLDFSMYSYGLVYTSASAAGLLVTVEPVATIALAAWLLNERLRLHRVAGSTLTLIGVALVNGDAMEWRDLTGELRWLGNLLVMMSAVAWSFYAVAQRRSSVGPTLFRRLASIFTVATLVAVPGLFLPGASEIHADPFGWSMLVTLTLLCTALVYLVYARAQQLMDISVLAVLLTSIPLFTLVFARFLLGEPITALLLIGATFVTLGILVIAVEPATEIRVASRSPT